MKTLSAIAIAAALAMVPIADQYGFVAPPYNYDAEYQRNKARCPLPWHPYLPGYHRCSGDDRHNEETRETQK